MTKTTDSITKLLTAARRGDAAAQYELATRYRDGNGVDIDFEHAFDWFSAATRLNHTEATRELGTMFRFGRGIEQNLIAAADFFVIAAKDGDVAAMANIADYLDELQKIALTGDATVSRCLTEIHNLGLGAEKSMSLTWAWAKWAKEGCRTSEDFDEATGIEEAYAFYKDYLSADDRREGERVLTKLLAAGCKTGTPGKSPVKRKKVNR